MNKFNCCLFIFLLSGSLSHAQNLVPNPSFEQFTICPMGYGEIYKASGWNIPLFSTTPDYFNACTPNLNVDVPQNLVGYENAHTGNAYAGIVTFDMLHQIPQQRNYREYMQCQLTDSLTAGVEYCVSWYVSACDSCSYVCNNMGMLFSPVQINDTCTPPNPCNLNYLPQVENPVTNNLNNRNGWTQISGTYTAMGGEKYIIIGNFRDTTGTTASYTGWGAAQPLSDLNFAAFYFIDDVQVAPAPCDSLTGMNENIFNTDFIVSPNPFSEELTINIDQLAASNLQFAKDKTQIKLFDIYGRAVLSQSLTTVNSKLQTANYSPGIYIYQILNNNEIIKTGKVVKE